jgi:hypothetical protein
MASFLQCSDVRRNVGCLFLSNINQIQLVLLAAWVSATVLSPFLLAAVLLLQWLISASQLASHVSA